MRGDDEGRRVLLIPFAPGIGDMVMMEPLLRAVRAGLPDWRLTMAARGYTADLLPPGGYALVSPFYFVTEAPVPLRPLHRLIPQAAIAWAAEPAMALDLGPFDRVINLFWVWESRVPFDQWWTPQWPPRRDVRHTVDLLADYLAEELGVEIPVPDRVPRLKPFPEGLARAEQYLRGRVQPGQPLAALVVSANNPLKWWAPPKWAELNEWFGRRGWQTLLVAPRDQAHAQQVHRACGGTPLWPEAGLREMGALLALCDVAVGIDTGPLHLAAALGTPWVGLFGPTNPDLIGPYDRSTGRPIVARFPKAYSCRDCWRSFKNRGARCPTLSATGCATLIPVDEVEEAIQTVRRGTRIA